MWSCWWAMMELLMDWIQQLNQLNYPKFLLKNDKYKLKQK